MSGRSVTHGSLVGAMHSLAWTIISRSPSLRAELKQPLRQFERTEDLLAPGSSRRADVEQAIEP